jgi:hypothetical protein
MSPGFFIVLLQIASNFDPYLDRFPDILHTALIIDTKLNDIAIFEFMWHTLRACRA